jgi:hypothetical protein
VRRLLLSAAALLSAVLVAPPVAAAPRFVDVPEGSWAEDAIEWAVDGGVLAPLTANRFGPTRPITRGQAIGMLWRLAGRPAVADPHDLRDVPPRLAAAVRWSVAERIATGYRDGTFRPAAAVSRAQLTSWLWALDGSPTGDPVTGLTDVEGTWAAPAVRWAVAEHLASGYRSGRFDGGGAVRRDQAVVWAHTWAMPRLPRVDLTVTRSDTNALTVRWEVTNGLFALAPQVDVEPRVGRRPARCEGACEVTVRTNESGVKRFTLTARNGAGGLTQAVAEVDVPDIPPPAPEMSLHRVDPFASPAEPQVVEWDPPAGFTPAPGDYVQVRRADSVFPLADHLPLDGSFTLTGDLRATTSPVSWSVAYCRRPDPAGLPLCSTGRLVTFDPRPVIVDAPFRRLVDVGEPATVTWTGFGEQWTVDAPTLGVHDQVVDDPTFTFLGSSVVEGSHAVTVSGDNGVADLVQLVAGLDEQRPTWTERDVADEFDVTRVDTTTRPTLGVPLDVTYGEHGDLWSVGEFSRDLARVHEGELQLLEVPGARREVVDGDGVTQRLPVRPFGNPLGDCVGASSESTALGERVIWTGEYVWFTQGGALGDPCPVANHSRLVRFDPGGVDDPHTEGDDRFCVVAVPGNDNNVVGIAHDPSTDRIWFSELDVAPDQGGGRLGWFDEDDVACDDLLDYEDPVAVTAAAQQHDGVIHWVDLGESHPTHVAIGQGAVWAADYVGAVLSRYPADGEGQLEQFPMPVPTATWSFLGSYGWQLRVTDDAVYLVEYSDGQVLRFDPETEEVDELFLPLGASTVNAHSVDVVGDRLWFTGANEAGSVRDPADTYVGWVDLAAWADGEPTGVLYTGFDQLPLPPERDHRSPRGIDVDEAGRVALAEMGDELMVLTPKA